MFKKLYLLVIFLAAFTAFSSGQNRKIEFIQRPWKDILAMSDSSKKLIFLDAYASWCGPCKWMAKNMFTQDSIADYFNSTFICVSMDMEKGEGIELAKKYQIRVYPTLLYIDSKGDVLHRKAGAPQRVQDYIDMGNTALDPVNRFSAIEKRYNSGERDPQLVGQYLKMLSEAYIPHQKVLIEYFALVPEADLISPGNWKIIFSYVNDPESPQIKYLIRNRKEFERQHSPDSVSFKLTSVYESYLAQAMRQRGMNDSIYAVLKDKVRKAGVPEAEKAIFSSDMNYYSMKQNVTKMLEIAYSDLEKFYGNDPVMLNNVAFFFSNAASDPKYLEKALEWSERSIRLNPQMPEYLDTYAGLLFKTGRKADAIEKQKLAIDLTKKQGKSTEELEKKLAEMQK